MTNIPSDLVCDDNTCESEVNMIYRDGEHRPIQDEQLMFEGNKLLPVVFVHKYNNYKHYISLKPDNTITWYDEEGVLAPKDIENAPVNGGDVQVEAIGNTLIVNSSNGLGYYLWKPVDGNYKYLGSKIPNLEMKFGFLRDKDYILRSDTIDLSGIVDSESYKAYVEEGQQSRFNDAVVGVYSSNKNKIAEKGGFVNPFFVRYAVEMYDGEYTNMSVPILMFPSVRHSVWLGERENDKGHHIQKWILATLYQKLIYDAQYDYTDWSDLVKNISIIISAPIDIYDTEVDQRIGDIGGVYWKSSFSASTISREAYYTDVGLQDLGYSGILKEAFKTDTTTGTYLFIDALVLKSESTIINELKETSVFYKIAELPISSKVGWSTVSIQDKKLSNLATLIKVSDDYFSNVEKYGNGIFAINNRLHLTNVRRTFWNGAEHFMPYDYQSFSGTYKVDVFVYISTPSGNRIVKRTIAGNESLGRTYFFYPDPRAKKVMFVMDKSGYNSLSGIFDNQPSDTKYMCLIYELKEHPFLNGSFWMGKLPREELVDNVFTYPDSIEDLPWKPLDEIPKENNTPEELTSSIWTSEVNNPWVFTAKGNNTIGSGEILGLASQTTALSQGQFGQYPLIAFCTDGIWALQTDNEGLYSAVHPMSREICNNPKSITETDGYVFFTTEKGLMVVDGGQVRCVSEQMSGKMADSSNAVVYNGALAESAPLWLKDYLKNCYIAYDYRDSLLWIFIPNRTIAFVYSMKDGTFGMKIIPNIQRAINDYPDTLLQDKNGKVYSLLNRDDINTDSNGYDCELISRPMKLENSTALKTLSRVKLIYELTHSTKAEVKVFASNDCKNWVRVLSLHGRGFKYWKFAIRFREMSAVDTFSGALINTQERYTYRMR